jgi:hypothetical protein
MNHIRSAAFYLPALLILLQSRTTAAPAIVCALIIAAVDVADRRFNVRDTPTGHAVSLITYLATAFTCGAWAAQ